MWVLDVFDTMIYAYDMDTKARDAAKDFDLHMDNTHPPGIWSDGTTMWVANDGTGNQDKIYAYNLSTKARDAGKDFNTLVAAGNVGPAGIWSDGTTMWVGDTLEGKLYAYKMSDKSRDADKDFDTLTGAGNENPLGIWSDGETMWVLDGDDEKIYSYNVPPSSDNTLRTLRVSPRNIIGFDRFREEYTVGVASSVRQATVTATPNHGSASVRNHACGRQRGRQRTPGCPLHRRERGPHRGHRPGHDHQDLRRQHQPGQR